jgi:hypothetical protein
MSNEVQPHVSHHVSALDPVHDVSPDGRYPGGSTLVAVPILVVWLYGTLVLAERRSGYVIMLVGSLLGLSMPVIHVMGAGGVFRGEIAKSSGAFLFVWTLHARRNCNVLPHPLGARTGEPATGPAPVVEEPWTAPLGP